MAESQTRTDDIVTRAVTDDSVTRAANDRIYDLVWGFEVETGSFLCECSPYCTEEVLMSAAEYVRLRDREEPVYATGHDSPESGAEAS